MPRSTSTCDCRTLPTSPSTSYRNSWFGCSWTGGRTDPGDDALLVLLRSAVTNDHAAARMRQVFAEQVAPALASALGRDLALRRAGLVAAQLLGLALTRYLLRIPAVTALSRDEVEDALTPAIRATLERA